MKALLAVLLTFVLLESQALAFHQPHPGEGGGFTGTVTGTYAGVLIPTSSTSFNTSDLTDISADDTNFNALGVFVFAVPTTGEAQGTFFTFSSGAFFNGVMVGIADPDTGLVSAVVQAVHIVASATSTDTANIVFDAESSGILKAQIVTDLTGNTAERLAGLAQSTIHIVDTFFNTNTTSFTEGEQFDFVIDGFKQSEDATVPTNKITQLLLLQ